MNTVGCLARSRKTTSVGRDKLRDLAQSFNDDNSCVTVDLPFRRSYLSDLTYQTLLTDGSYLSDQFLAKTYATYQKQFFCQFYKQ